MEVEGEKADLGAKTRIGIRTDGIKNLRRIETAMVALVIALEIEVDFEVSNRSSIRQGHCHVLIIGLPLRLEPEIHLPSPLPHEHT
jgi:hypothetical protein